MHPDGHRSWIGRYATTTTSATGAAAGKGHEGVELCILWEVLSTVDQHRAAGIVEAIAGSCGAPIPSGGTGGKSRSRIGTPRTDVLSDAQGIPDYKGRQVYQNLLPVCCHGRKSKKDRLRKSVRHVFLFSRAAIDGTFIIIGLEQKNLWAGLDPFYDDRRGLSPLG